MLMFLKLLQCRCDDHGQCMIGRPDVVVVNTDLHLTLTIVRPAIDRTNQIFKLIKEAKDKLIELGVLLFRKVVRFWPAPELITLFQATDWNQITSVWTNINLHFSFQNQLGLRRDLFERRILG